MASPTPCQGDLHSTVKDSQNRVQKVDLCLFVSQGNIQVVRSLLETNPSLLNRRRWSGVGPLHRAVAKGNLEMVQLLVDHNADVNERAAWGWYSPLHLACKYGHEDIIRLLLTFNANWNTIDKWKKTPLQWAIAAGHPSMGYRIDQVRNILLILPPHRHEAI